MMDVKVDSLVLDARRESEYANANLARLRAQKQVLDEKAEKGYDYKKCADSAKSEVTSGLKSYVSLFKKESLKSMAKQIAAQWFVVIDAVGKDKFNSELSKFDKSATDLKIELALN